MNVEVSIPAASKTEQSPLVIELDVTSLCGFMMDIKSLVSSHRGSLFALRMHKR